MSWTQGQPPRVNLPPFIEPEERGNQREPRQPNRNSYQEREKIAATFTKEGLETFSAIFSSAVEAAIAKALPDIVDDIVERVLQEVMEKVVKEMKERIDEAILKVLHREVKGIPSVSNH